MAPPHNTTSATRRAAWLATTLFELDADGTLALEQRLRRRGLGEKITFRRLCAGLR